MAKSDIIHLARDLLYGQGLGEHPRFVRADSSNAVVGGTVPYIIFDLTAGDGAKVRGGDLLSSYQSTDPTYYRYRVISVSTDQVTAVSEDGTQPINPSLDSVVFEVNPLVSEFTLSKTIDTIVGTWLYPNVFTIDASPTVTPDLTDGQVELPAATREILSAHQIVNGTVYDVEFGLTRNVSTSISSTGVLGFFRVMDGSTVYFTAVEEVLATTSDVHMQYLIATGAAALALDGTVAETTLESAKSDSQNRNAEMAASALWRSFLTQRQQVAENLSRDTLRLEIVR